MDKTMLKDFAIYSRNRLIQEIKNKASLIGIGEEGIEDPLPESTSDMLLFDIGTMDPYMLTGKEIKQYEKLKRELETREENEDYQTAYSTLIEEVAYTWFNRLIALRFMEVNNYMPNRLRTLSSGIDGVNEPELVANYEASGFDFTKEEENQLLEWRLDASADSMEKMFQYLFIKQCNALNDNLPELFEKTDDYAELLLTISYNDKDGVLYKLIHEIPEAYFDVETDDGNGQVEIIGWMYQYYNSELKDEVFARPASKKIAKEDIPAATQLFTPDWIVKYMVENSLGRLWIEKLLASGDDRSEKDIADSFGWEYYIPEAEQEEEVQEELIEIRAERKDLNLEDITFMDPAMGSFHIGVYAFDIFMQLYESQGYTSRDAAKLIIEKNLYGIDIDKRAYQLSYFAIMMKGRQFNRRILDLKIKTNLYKIVESNNINKNHLDYLGNNIEDKEKWKQAKENIIDIIDTFIDAKEYGSILKIEDEYDFELLKEFVSSNNETMQVTFETVGIEETQKNIMNIIEIARTLTKKYDVVSTNPPYLGSRGMNSKLKKYLDKNYPESKSDLFAVFMETCKDLTSGKGYYSIITQHSWMFLSSYEGLRDELQDQTLMNMLHLGTRAFEEIGGEVVQTTAFIYKNGNLNNYLGNYIRLVNINTAKEKEEKTLEAIASPTSKYFYRANQNNFKIIPGSPIAYWVSDNLIDVFESAKPMGELVDPRQGLATANNNRFLRLWHEVAVDKIKFNSKSISESVDSKAKWFPYNKGGARRQWYGNYDYIVNWENDGHEIRNFKDNSGRVRSRPQNSGYYFKESITWSLITSGGFSIRYREAGSIHDVAGMSAFDENHETLIYLLGLLGTKIADYIFKILNPTLNLQIGNFNDFPVLISDNKKITEKVEGNIDIAKKEWDSYENSWDFKKHPFMKYNNKLIEESYKDWKDEVREYINKTKTNEEELNKIFIELYGLEDELTSDVDIKDITLREANIKKDMKSFISYAVGCMFGRYSLDEEGLVYAGGDWDGSRYKTFKPTEDNVLIITDEEYFEDDIVNRFVEFVEVTYGKETLDENLEFIADSLTGGGSPKEKIRNYFMNGFYKDHVQTYKKTPIYWLYDSSAGKYKRDSHDGFKTLIYMHRYDEDTTGKVRIDYLHKLQKEYEFKMDNLRYEIEHSENTRQVARAEKELDKLTKQLKEAKDYDEKIGHLALARIPIDLDDGVKVNYDKIQKDENGKKLKILAKI